MKIKRQKHAKKNLSFYRYNFRIREPYQVLLDGTFCQAALRNKIQIKEQLPKYLMGEVQLCTSQDQDLATKIKKRAGVPLMFIIQNTIVLDKPSPKSVAHVQAAQSGQLVPEHQKQNIEALKDEQGVTKDTDQKGKKRKRISGPNPLSCKKKKKTPTQPTASVTEQLKKKRKRKRGKSVGKETLQTA
ncbi:rRNA-processing protein UTP23 homolog [Discoglossus pictus]